MSVRGSASSKETPVTDSFPTVSDGFTVYYTLESYQPPYVGVFYGSSSGTTGNSGGAGTGTTGITLTTGSTGTSTAPARRCCTRITASERLSPSLREPAKYQRESDAEGLAGLECIGLVWGVVRVSSERQSSKWLA